MALSDPGDFGLLQIAPTTDEDAHWGASDPVVGAFDLWIGRLDSPGYGSGEAVIGAALARSFGDPDVDVARGDPWVDNPSAHRFSEKAGMRFARERWFDQDHCYVYEISRAEWAAAR